MKVQHAHLHQSTAWFIASAICFALVIVATCLAGQRLNTASKDYPELRQTHTVPASLVEDGNPAPSVHLKVTSAPWCIPCKRLKPILDKLKKEGYSIKVNVLDDPGVSVPRLDFQKFGQSEKVLTGYQSEDKIKKVFAEIEGAVFTPPKKKWLNFFWRESL